MICAKQVPPEYQESYLDLDSYPEVILDGNRFYVSHTNDVYDMMKDNFWECVECFMDAETDDDKAPVIYDYFPPIGRSNYTDKEIKKISNCLIAASNMGIVSVERQVCDILAAMVDIEYAHAEIRGSCQTDWQNMYYPKSWGESFVRHFECEYFNEGSEWVIDDDYSCYVHAWDEDGMRKELAEITGENTDNITMLFFDGWERTAKYRAG